MLLPYIIPRAVIAVTFLLCSSYTLPVICGATNPKGNSMNAGASSSFSPFYYYSRTLTDGWTIRLREEGDLTLFIPIQTSAVHLVDFYTAVFQSASDKIIALAPPVASCILRLGQLELLVSARSVPVPWSLIALFAANMLYAARRGYTAGYSVEFVPPGETSTNSPNATQITLIAGDAAQNSNGPGDGLVTNGELSDSDDGVVSSCRRHCPGSKRSISSRS